MSESTHHIALKAFVPRLGFPGGADNPEPRFFVTLRVAAGASEKDPTHARTISETALVALDFDQDTPRRLWEIFTAGIVVGTPEGSHRLVAALEALRLIGEEAKRPKAVELAQPPACVCMIDGFGPPRKN